MKQQQQEIQLIKPPFHITQCINRFSPEVVEHMAHMFVKYFPMEIIYRIRNY